MGTRGRRSPRRRYPRSAAPSSWPSPGAGRHPAAPRRGVSENKLLPAPPAALSSLPASSVARPVPGGARSASPLPAAGPAGSAVPRCPEAGGPAGGGRDGREGRGQHPPWRADGGRVPLGERRARGPRSDGEASSRRGKLKLLTAASAELRGAGGAGRRGDRWGPRVPLAGSARLRRRFSMRAAATPCPRTLMGRGGIVDRLRLRPEGCHRPSLQFSWGRNKAGCEAARNLSPLKCCACYTASEALLGECCQ